MKLDIFKLNLDKRINDNSIEVVDNITYRKNVYKLIIMEVKDNKLLSFPIAIFLEITIK